MGQASALSLRGLMDALVCKSKKQKQKTNKKKRTTEKKEKERERDFCLNF